MPQLGPAYARCRSTFRMREERQPRQSSLSCLRRVIRDRCEPAACPAMSASTPIATVSQRPPCATWSNAGADDGDEIPPSAGLHKFRRHLLPLVPLIQATYRASRAIPELRAAPAGRVNCSGSDSAPAAEPEAGFARQRSSHRATAPAIRLTRYALTAWRYPSVQTDLGAYRVGQRPDRAVRRRSPRSPPIWASPNNRATAAMARSGVRSTPETAGCLPIAQSQDGSRRFATTKTLFSKFRHHCGILQS